MISILKPMQRRIQFLLMLFLILAISRCVVLSQVPNVIKKNSSTKPTIITPNIPPVPIQDSTKETKSSSSLVIQSDSGKVAISDSSAKSSGGIDSVITYKARDSVVFFAKSKRMHLKGDATAKFKTQKLDAEVIDIYFDKSLMQANGSKDSSGKTRGYPMFTDNGKEFVGETIKYNFSTKAGTVTMGETTMENGFYYGSRIKRVDENTLYVENGCYTTCDHPHPHFYFSSPKMKVIPGDRIFFEDLYLYVQDIPVLYLPIGAFFPNRGGRQSGLLIPVPSTDVNRGVVFRGIGYYFALSDYYDTKITADIYSKGGIQINNNWQYKLLYNFNGSLDLKYAYLRDNPAQPFITQYSIGLTHYQEITQQTKLSGNLAFQSNDFNRLTAATLSDRIKQNVTSFAALTHSFDNGATATLDYNRNQDIVLKTYNQSPRLSFSFPTWMPFKSASGNSMFDNLALSYGLNAPYNDSYDRNITSTYFVENDSIKINPDTTFQSTYKFSIQHSPSITISPKVGFFTIQPTISLGWNTYTRRITRLYNSTTQQSTDAVEYGVFNELRYSGGISTSTTLYGISKPRIFGINALRHTFRPTVSLNYSPDQSGNTDYWATFISPRDSLVTSRDTLRKAADTVQYSRFALDGGGISNRSKSLSMGFSLSNYFDMKVAQGDSADKNVELFGVDINSSYNFIASSFKLSPINFSLRTPSLGFLNWYASGTFTPYQEVLQLSKQFDSVLVPVQIDEYLGLSNGLLRLTNFSISMSFSTQGGNTPSAQSSPTDTTKKDSSSSQIGSRFQRRMEYQESDADLFGDKSPGFSHLNLPWNISGNLNYTYNKFSAFRDAQKSLNLSGNFQIRLTTTWDIGTGFNYDFINSVFGANTVNITKQIHCWALSFTWTPSGPYTGYYLRFGASASLLQDLQLEKRSSPIFR